MKEFGTRITKLAFSGTYVNSKGLKDHNMEGGDDVRPASEEEIN
jgi:hypothetical protein